MTLVQRLEAQMKQMERLDKKRLLAVKQAEEKVLEAEKKLQEIENRVSMFLI